METVEAVYEITVRVPAGHPVPSEDEIVRKIDQLIESTDSEVLVYRY